MTNTQYLSLEQLKTYTHKSKLKYKVYCFWFIYFKGTVDQIKSDRLTVEWHIRWTKLHPLNLDWDIRIFLDENSVPSWIMWPLPYEDTLYIVHSITQFSARKIRISPFSIKKRVKDTYIEYIRIYKSKMCFSVLFYTGLPTKNETVETTVWIFICFNHVTCFFSLTNHCCTFKRLCIFII